MKSSESTIQSLRNGFIDALPVTASYIVFAAIFGMLSLQTGLSPWQSIAMSIIVYAGSAQFTALSMLAEQASPWAIIFATFLLNSRHLLMGLSLSPYYQGYSRLQLNSVAFLLTDESYAISLNRLREQPKINVSYVVGVSLSLYLAWIGGTWLGTMAGQWIPDPASLGLGFSFTAMFLALAYYQLGSLVRILTFVACGLVATWLALFLPNGLHLLIAGLLAFVVGFSLPLKQAAQTSEDARQEVEPA
ncbi:AzlC family ABC transporter permease [Brevibacillus fulvus]|uniref:4-azaleucine resistance transporter AzlC n=1 Tax=Brevibacillus fulvus TaxID=1125967 RepID=A0A938Y3J2_9BACL|nr:AzlC family ABC transporter permease [Brevibacillus fulvus]MBM7590952.1 4-azaleucine resistance transporter AzlC [Brevibacillus fulvus]